MLGSVESAAEGRLALRLQKRLQHSPDRVWTAITRVGEFESWFPGLVDKDFSEAAELRFDMTAEQRAHMGIPDGEEMSSVGRVTRFDPANVLEYTWGAETLRWELSPAEDGCELVFIDIFDDRDLAAQMASSWHAVLDLFEAHLDAREIDWTVWDREAELRDDYLRTVKVG